MKVLSSISIALLATMAVFVFFQNEKAQPSSQKFEKTNEKDTPIYDLFKAISEKDEMNKVVKNAHFFRLDQGELERLYEERPNHFTLQLPGIDGVPDELSFDKKQVEANDLFLHTADGQPLHVKQGVHYRQVKQGDAVAAMSVFEGKLSGLIGTAEGNFSLSELTEHPGEYILFNDAELTDPTEVPSCEMHVPADFSMPKYAEYSQFSLNGNNPEMDPDDAIVRVAVETDLDMLTMTGGTVQDVFDYVTTLFNFTAMVYEVEDVYIQLSELIVWTEMDPYLGDPLGKFITKWQDAGLNFNGDIIHLLRGFSGGGTAWVGVLCDSDLPAGQSGVSLQNWSNFPNYLSSVYVFAHEIGHNLGSLHTHDCVWGPGGNEAIDNCATPQGGCDPGPPPVNGGTIMSYCGGFNLLNAFGPEPGDVIRAHVAGATCLKNRQFYDDCQLDSVIIQEKCLPDGTPNDPTDDVFEVILHVRGNGPANSLQAVDVNTGQTWTFSFDEEVTIGPFDAFPGWRYLQINNLQQPQCNTERAIFPPPSCFQPNQCAPFVWEANFSGSSDETIYDVAALPDGGFVATGFTQSDDGIFQPSQSADIFIVKTDGGGNQQWLTQYPGNGYDVAQKIFAMPDGGSLVVGYTGSGTGVGQGTHGANDGLAIRLDANGDEVWRKLYGGSITDVFFSGLPLPGGDFLLGGYTYSTDFDVPPNSGNGEGWIIRINSSGDLIWSKTYGGGTLRHEVHDLSLGHNGAIAVTGLEHNSNPSNGIFNKAWAMEINPDGTENWLIGYPNPLRNEWGKAIQPGANGQYLLFSNDGKVNMFTLDGSGNQLDKRRIANSLSAFVNETEMLPNGNIALTGWRNSIPNLSVSSNSNEFWLYLLSPEGDKIYESTYGLTNVEIGYGLALTNDGGYVLAGNRQVNTGSLNNNGLLMRLGTDICAQTGICFLSPIASNIQCDDNGTPSDPSDDTFTFDVTVNGSTDCGSGWTGGGQSGSYGATVSFGPYLVSTVSQSLTFADADDPGASASITVSAPSSCSVPPDICQSNLLTNGGFENGVNSWNVSSAAVGVTTDAFDGNQAAEICDGSGTIGQVFPTTPGTDYIARMWGKQTGNPPVGYAWLRFLDSSFTPLQNTPGGSDEIEFFVTTTYEEMNLTATAPPGAAYVHLYILKESGGCIFIDKVELCPDLVGSIISIDCPDNITVTAPVGQNEAVVTFSPATASTTCAGTATVTQTNGPPSGSVFLLGTTEICFEATDGCGNSTSCCFDVTVESSTTNPCNPDVTDPVIANCPGNISQNTSGNSATVSWTPPTASDNCPGNVTLTSTHQPGDLFPLGTTTVVYTATDAAGNTATCSFTVTVTQITGGDIDLELSLAQPNANPAQWSSYMVIATLENNGGDPATGVQVSFPKPNGVVYTGGNEYDASQGTFNPNGNQIWTVGTIPAGGSATLEVNYFLLVSQGPVAYAQVSAANETDVDSTPGNGTPPTPNEDDEASTDDSPDPCNPDVTDPVIANCPNDISETTSGNSATVSWTAPTTSDNCPGTVNLTSTHQPGDLFSLGTTTVVYTATDAAGNSATCSFDVTVSQTGDCNPDVTNPVISGCPGNQSATSTGDPVPVNWTAPTASDNCPGTVTLTSTHGPGDLFPLGNTMVVYTATDASGNSTTCSFNVSVTQIGNGDIDLELSLAQPNANPAQWSSYPVIATLANTGSQTATGVAVSFPKPTGVVYTGGNEYDASQGTFNPNGNEIWTVGSIPAGGSATLEVNYFLLVASAPVAYAQVSAATETDGDSTPGNGTPPTPNEDDEASTDSSPPNPMPDLVMANLGIQNSPIDAGEILLFNFDISNQGNADANGNFNVKAYISTDNTLSPDDIQDGIVPTGNYPAGQTITNIPGASTIPAGLADGNYFIILKVDADEEIAEGNEGNNLISAPFSVGDGNPPGDGVDLELSMTTDNPSPPAFSNVEIELTINNTGTDPATGVVVEFKRPSSTVYTGGNEWDATQGVFNPFGPETWEVGSIPADGSATLTVSYFLLTGNALTPFAEVLSLNEDDEDSTPGNGTCCTPNEDDEATLTLNALSGGGSNSLELPTMIGRDVQLRSIDPNPVYFGETTVTLLSRVEGNFDLECYDLFGRLVFSQNVELREGKNKIPLDVAYFRSGTYYLNMPGQNWRNMPIRFVVARW